MRDWQVDWKRVGDYLLGRSTLIGIASLMLLFISGYATWHGMRDFIVGVSAASNDSGGLSLSNDVLVLLVVAALTFLMWLALRETFGSHRRLAERLITIPLYLFLAIWSIGFGYGFWWSLIAGEDATRYELKRHGDLYGTCLIAPEKNTESGGSCLTTLKMIYPRITCTGRSRTTGLPISRQLPVSWVGRPTTQRDTRS